jgi:hypothetical protein
MKSAKKIIFTFFLLVLTTGSAQKTIFAQVLLTPEEMQQDLDYVADLIRRVHPDPFHALAEAEFNALVQDLGQSITTPLSREEFFFILKKLTNTLKDGHTELYYSPEQSYVPARFYWAVDGVVVTVARSGCGLEFGDKVVSLGEKDAWDLLDQLAQLIATENAFWLRDRSAEALSRGSFLRHLGLIEDNSVRFVVEDIRGNSKDVRVSLTPDPPPSEPTSSRPFCGWSLDEAHSLGLFYLDQCYFNTAYQSALQNFFEEVKNKGIKRVALDIRRNTGGSSFVVDEFLRYMPVRFGGWFVHMPYTKVRGFLTDIRYSPEAASQQNYSQTSGYQLADLNLRLIGANLMRIPPPSSLDSIFHGDAFILTSGRTYSSANWFAVLFQDNRLGSILGEPTGNKPTYFGHPLNFITPNSQFNLYISHKKFYRPDYTKDSLDSVLPDFYFPTRVGDIREARDAQMEGLLSLLSGSRLDTGRKEKTR